MKLWENKVLPSADNSSLLKISNPHSLRLYNFAFFFGLFAGVAAVLFSFCLRLSIQFCREIIIMLDNKKYIKQRKERLKTGVENLLNGLWQPRRKWICWLHTCQQSHVKFVIRRFFNYLVESALTRVLSKTWFITIQARETHPTTRPSSWRKFLIHSLLQEIFPNINNWKLDPLPILKITMILLFFQSRKFIQNVLLVTGTKKIACPDDEPDL